MERFARAMDEEADLLQGLLEVLQRQREGVAASDLERLHGSVLDAQRLLLTLEQARHRRRTLMEVLCGDPDASVQELEEQLGATAHPALLLARDRLVQDADAVARALRVNHRILNGAMAAGQALARGIGGGAGLSSSAVYVQGGMAPAPTPADTGLVLNRQV